MSAPILIVDDDLIQRQMLSTLLRRKMDYESCTAENGRVALDIIEQDQDKKIKLVILDLEMPVMDGMETLQILRQKHPDIPAIMLTGSQDIQDAIEAMKLGATDFLTKPFEGDRMMVTVKNALKLSTLSKEVTRLKHESEGKFTFSDLIGNDGGLLPVVSTATKAAASDIPVLITGETGTGKEVFCKAIHGESARTGKPFIAVNCGAIPSQLVESTLFGHEKGSFTGATEKAAGKFREADGGTIFLDEVGELPLDIQVKLLRALQQKEVEPVGSAKPIPVNVRIISATNRDLEQEVQAGNFREDLYFRLNVLQIHLPPLRERKDDIPALTLHFIERFCAGEHMVPKTVSPDAQSKLCTHDWPGNVRELENTLNRAVVVSNSNVIEVEDLWPAGTAGTTGGHDSFSPITSPALSSTTIDMQQGDGSFKTVKDIEREAVQRALDHFDGNITQAAQAIGMAKSTFYKKIQGE